MIRRLFVLTILVAGGLSLAGCPVTSQPTGSADLPSGDPTITSEPFMSINSNASFLQFNALGLSQPQFPRSADLTAVVSNAEATQIDWQITSTGTSIIRFVDASGNLSETTTGDAVTATAVQAATADVSHEVIATATLTDGSTLTATIEIVVTRDPLVSGASTVLTANPTADPVVGRSASGEVKLNAGITGATGTVLVDWSPVDPASIPSGITLPTDLTTEQITLQVADGVSGVFPFLVVASDSVGNVASAIVNVFLGVVDLTLDVSVTRVQLNPASQVMLRTIRAGGIADLDTSVDDTFSYSWLILDEANTDVTGAATISPPPGALNDANPIDWTVTGLSPGAYRFICTLSDRAGHQQIESAAIILTENLGLTVAPSVARAGVNGGFSLQTLRTGGQPPYTYTFSVVDSGGTDSTAQTSFTPASGTTSSTPANDWMVSGFAAADTYRFAVTVTDGAGNTATASTPVAVGDVLTLDAKADDLFVDPSNTTTLTFDVNGGVGPYTYTFSNFTNATGTPAFSLASPAASAGDLTLTWTAPPSAAGVSGAYRTDVTVTDAAGNTANDSVVVNVGGGGGSGANYTVDVQARFAQVGTDATYTPLLRTSRVGGMAPFAWTWAVYDEAGNDVAGANPATQIAVSAAGDDQAAVVDWNVTVGSMVPAGTYRFEATITDGNTDIAVGSTEILINDTVTVALSARSTLVAPGVPVEITATPAGGSGTYSYAFTNAVDAEGNTAGTIAANPGNGATGSTVWVPPTDGNGTYTLSVTVTDTTLNTTATASLDINVTDAIDLRRGEIIIDAPTAQTDLSAADGLFENGPAGAGLDINGLGGATAVASFTPETPDPGLGYARSLTVRIVANIPSNHLVVNSVSFAGTNQRGEAIFTSFVPTTPFGGTDTVNVPFKTLNRVTIDYANAEAGDTIEIGIGEWFGLSAPFPTASEAQADRAFHIVATGASLDTNPEAATFLDPEDNAAFETVSVTPDHQAVRFTGAAPNGTNDYIVQFEPLSDLTVDLDIDAFLLSAAMNDTANISADVHGGIPPYRYRLNSVGVLGVPMAGTLTLPDGFDFANVAGDFPAVGQVRVQAGGAPAGTEVHWLRVLVTDSAANEAVATVPVLVAP